MENPMNLFEAQLRQRIKQDSQETFSSMMDAVEAARGREYVRTDLEAEGYLLREMERICRFFRLSMPQTIDKTDDSLDLIDQVIQPLGIMRRTVELENNWWQDGEGLLLVTRQSDNRPFALLQGVTGRYYYFDEAGRKKWVTKLSREQFVREAICFYRPLPGKALSTREFVRFLLKCVPASDYVKVALVSLLAVLVSLLFPLATSIIFANIVPTGRVMPVIAIASVLYASSVAAYLLSIPRSGLLDRIRGRIEVVMQNGVMSRIISLPMQFFSDKSSGSLSDSVLALKRLPGILTESILAPGIDAVLSLVYVVEIFAFAPSLVLPALCTLLVQGLIIALSVSQKTKVTRTELEANMEAQGLSYALITGIARIRLSGSEERALGRWLRIYKRKSRSAYHFIFPAFMQNELVAFTALLGTLWAYMAGAHANLEISQFAAFLSSFAFATAALQKLSASGKSLALLSPTLKMIEPVLKTVPEVDGQKARVQSLSGRIEINHLSFRYRPDDRLILNDLNVKIKAGEYVAIVGKSGCGKSTLVRLLLGFEAPLKGAILYDSRNMNDLNLASLRRNIGTVLQNEKLFAEDIFTNITISAPWLTEKDAWEAAEMADIADEIRQMPMRMHTMISEGGGGGISGGQKQRLMIARAIAPRPKILIFDEATSALDNITQKAVSDALDRLKCTRIVIAHRLSTIRNCDRILVLDQGRIIEEGSYDDLIAQNGFFAELVARQQV